MMNVVAANTPQGVSFTDAELIIDFNALDTVSVTFDESELSLKAENRSRCFDKPCFPSKPLNEQAKIVVDDATAATVASSTSFLTIPSTKKQVRFGSLTINSHFVELGGSGVPGCGPSITLGWEKESSISLQSVEEYEDAKPYLPRRGIEMLHPKKQRVNMLLESGYTLNQIRTCDQECEALRKQRTRTVQQVTLADRTKSKLKKLVVWKKGRKEQTE
eukprot:CAMPEP_0116141950 /NCGR_PEP_ID=MMETSP0329-20121206/14649_1 /TAXON_ID=697910 /ORGANISM="Pseudo-nitzschia arenysensis, Strain B593" /LENGTH=217 /DNA_ID=CAMNT_0003637155 /DNA_START=98 /DNA_END=751 /DNA_ORIENTATION=-